MLEGISFRFCNFIFLFLVFISLVRLNGKNNKKIRDLYELYIELGHDAFEEEIKKRMEACLHNSDSNVISMNSSNTIHYKKFGHPGRFHNVVIMLQNVGMCNPRRFTRRYEKVRDL